MFLLLFTFIHLFSLTQMDNSIATKKKSTPSSLSLLFFNEGIFYALEKKCKHPKSSQNELAPPTHTMWVWFMKGGHEMFLYWPLIPYRYNG
jgi:hypothetical protein